jgi:serine/threonine protein kinase
MDMRLVLSDEGVLNAAIYGQHLPVGFANVMEGYDRERNQRCAVKVFRSEVKDKAWIQRRSEQEVAALRKVRHPNAQDIWRRHVKPENVIVRNEGLPEEEAVLIDFSTAIVRDANETLHGLSRAAGSFDLLPIRRKCAAPVASPRRG